MSTRHAKGAPVASTSGSCEDEGLDLDQYLTLGLSGEIFAVPVQQVREVLDLQKISRLANAPAMLLGMIDVRGTAIPVADLKQQLGLDPMFTTEHSRIVVLDLGGDGRELLVGAVTDAVYEVADFPPGELAPPPTLNQRWDSSIIKAIARRNGQFVTVLDLGRVFAGSGLDLEGLSVG
jgi:purine-binding chemotaxis protein CheW